MAKENEPKAGMITAAQAAQLVVLSLERLRQLATSGYIPRAIKGHYPLVGLVQGYVKYLREEQRTTTKVAADNSLKASRQRLIDMQIARDEGRIIDMDDVEAVVSEMFTTLRSELTGVPASVTRDRKIRDAIEKAHNEAFARSQAKFRETCEALRAGRDPLGTDGADDA